MSTAAKRPLAEAMSDADEFRRLFDPSCYERWEFAGSVRRQKPEVADIEHVIIPAFGEVAGDGLFGETKATNLLWRRLDELLAAGRIAKHLYGTTPTGAPLYRWGEKYRGVDCRRRMHELFTATAQSWGAILLIRTGPADYSERVVTALKSGGMYRQQEGRLVHVASGEAVDVPDEETYLRLAGMKYASPEARR